MPRAMVSPSASPSLYRAKQSGRKTDILLANILAEPLLELAPIFAERVATGGRVVLSGILQSQAARRGKPLCRMV